MAKKNNRPDHQGPHRAAYEKNKKKLLKLQPEICPLCGRELDYSIKYPDPFSPTIDHIIPIDRGGHPSDISNLEVVHRHCNLEKSDKLLKEKPADIAKPKVTNRDLPQHYDWAHYKAGDLS